MFRFKPSTPSTSFAPGKTFEPAKVSSPLVINLIPTDDGICEYSESSADSKTDDWIKTITRSLDSAGCSELSLGPSASRNLKRELDSTEVSPFYRSRKHRRLDSLEEELERTQLEIGHDRDFDVHRGKGQGVKNINARFYTPLIAYRAIEYSQVNEESKADTDAVKRSIAVEILLELARKGGQIRDVDNVTPLANDKAIKKVMNALKDKAREMKKKQSELSCRFTPTIELEDNTTADLDITKEEEEIFNLLLETGFGLEEL